jgi:hypothetical protein
VGGDNPADWPPSDVALNTLLGMVQWLPVSFSVFFEAVDLNFNQPHPLSAL